MDISYPQSSSGTTAPTPSPNAVSEKIGDTTEGSKSYPILFPVGSGSSISLTTGLTDGLWFPTGTTVSSGATSSSAALSITDFNIFRGNMISALNVLDQKIRDILDVTKPTCP